MIFLDENGEELPMKTGKTFIQIVNNDQSVGIYTEEEKEGWKVLPTPRPTPTPKAPKTPRPTNPNSNSVRIRTTPPLNQTPAPTMAAQSEVDILFGN